MNLLRIFTPTIAALCMLGSAHALTVHHTISLQSNEIALQMSDWELETLLLPQFNSSQGTLDSVSISLMGKLAGSAAAENTGRGAAQVTLNLTATLVLVDPLSGATLVHTTPSISNSFAASAYDGVTDYGGTSGRSYAHLASQSSATSLTFTDGATLARFTGGGTVGTQLLAFGESYTSSAANISADFTTNAGGYASVTYHYHTTRLQVTAVPEPETWALMLVGLALVSFLAKRRQP